MTRRVATIGLAMAITGLFRTSVNSSSGGPADGFACNRSLSSLGRT
jgi:hypothetical protein